MNRSFETPPSSGGYDTLEGGAASQSVSQNAPVKVELRTAAGLQQTHVDFPHGSERYSD
jgi:hypothetical protein